MAPKKPKAAADGKAKKSAKSKGKKKEEVDAESVAEAGPPKEFFPLLLTSATQEAFGCRADEDVTQDNPYKLLRKDDILQDVKAKGALSDLHPAKQYVLDYPGEELLLVFDREFTHGECFYFVLNAETKTKMLEPPVPVEEEIPVEASPELFVYKTPEPKPWVSLGSELEVEEESVRDTRQRLKYCVSRVRRQFGAPVNFSDRCASEKQDGYLECTSYQDNNFQDMRMEQNTGIQAVPVTKNSSTQTKWAYPKNMCTQYETREISEEEKENCLNSENLMNFVKSVIPRFNMAIQQNELMNVFCDDWQDLCKEDPAFTGKTHINLKGYQSFTDLKNRDKTVSAIAWHPTISGVIAVALTEKMSLEERINSTKMILNHSHILFWSFSDPINPQLSLESSEDIFCFEFCPTDTSIIAGGCMNGQILLWDISSHVELLQSTSLGKRKKNARKNTLLSFEDKRENVIPVLQCCAASTVGFGHKAPVTDIQWLPDSYEVSKAGAPIANFNQLCVQLVTCAPDCFLMFWDVRPPPVATQSQADKKRNEKPAENIAVTPVIFKHLNIIWKPLMRAALPKIEGTGEYSPLKFCLRDSPAGGTTDNSTQNKEQPQGRIDYSELKVPSIKESEILDNIDTKLYIGTEDGEIMYADWKKDTTSESGKLFSVTSSHCFPIHGGLVNTVRRSPFFKDIILTVGGWTFAIWKEGVMNGPILHSSCTRGIYTVGYWSLSRPGVFFIGKENGEIEVWDLLEMSHEPAHIQNISTSSITCIVPWITSSKLHFLAVSDYSATLHILEIPWILRNPSDNEISTVAKFFDKEVERLLYFDKQKEMRHSQKKEIEPDEMKKKMTAVTPVKLKEHADQESLLEYKQFLDLQKAVLKSVWLS